MRKVILLILFPFCLAYSKSITIDKDIEMKLNLKTIKVDQDVVKDSKVYPGMVYDNPSISFDVSTPVDGIVESVYVRQGDVVKKGTILIKVYSPTIADIQANIEMAKVKLKAAEDVLEREQMLYREEVIPYSRYYSAKIDYERAKGELDALLKAKRSYGEVVEGRFIVVRSPIDGFVAYSKAIRGMAITVGDTVMNIHSHNVLLVEGMVPYEDTKFLRVGQNAFVINPEGIKVEGKITLINHEIDPKTSRNMVRIEVRNPKELIKPNMFVNVEFPIHLDKGIYVPQQALVNVDGKNFVFVKQSGKAYLREVKVGKRVKDSVEIVSGLKPKEEVFVQGVIFLKAQLLGGGQ